MSQQADSISKIIDLSIIFSENPHSRFHPPQHDQQLISGKAQRGVRVAADGEHRLQELALMRTVAEEEGDRLGDAADVEQLMRLVLFLREEAVDGVAGAPAGLAEGEVEGGRGEDLGVEEVLAVLPQHEAGAEVDQLAQQPVAPLVLEEHVGRLDVPVEHCVPLQETHCLRQLLEDSDVLQQGEVVEVVVRAERHLSEEVSALKPRHYGALGNSFDGALVDVEIVLADEGTLQVAIDHQEVVLVLVAALRLRLAAAVLTGLLAEVGGAVSGGRLLLRSCGAALENEVFLVHERTLSIAISEIVLYLWLLVSRPQ